MLAVRSAGANNADACRDFAVMAEALKILQEMLCVLGKSMTPELPKVMAAVWRLFEAAPAAFEALVLPRSDAVEDADDAGDVEGGAGVEVVTFETVVEQLYELLLTVLSAASLQEQLKSALQVMAFNTITFMQVQITPSLSAPMYACPIALLWSTMILQTKRISATH